VRFTAAYNGAWCMPSRATMLTGHHQFGVESMRMEGPYPGCTYDPQQCPFWPKVFRANGYFTAQIGKWHTGTDTGYGRDWDFQLVWNRPKYTETSAKTITTISPSPTMAARRRSSATRRISTRIGPST
jgi:arylsulfatase A-like enzyme